MHSLDKSCKIAVVTDTRIDGLKSAVKNPTNLLNPIYQEVVIERYSKASISIIRDSILKRGFEADVISDSRELAEFVKVDGAEFPYSAVVNLATGTCAPMRAGQAAIMLDMLRVPYSGSTAQTLLVLRDKSLCKVIAEHVGVNVPHGMLLNGETQYIPTRFRDDLYPLILKPNFGCTSFGVSSKTLDCRDNHESAIAPLIRKYPEGVLVERFIPGVEITVFVIGHAPDWQIVPLVLTKSNGELTPADYILSSKRKQLRTVTSGVKWALAESRLSPSSIKSIKGITMKLVEVFHIRDYARFDYRIDAETNEIFFIECNGQPGLDCGSNSIPTTINSLLYKETSRLQDLFVGMFLKRVFGSQVQ